MDRVVATSLLAEMLCKKNSTRALAEKHFITQESDLPEQSHSDDAKRKKTAGGRPKTGAFEVTQVEAATMLGVSERTIRDWERGRKTPQGYPGREDTIVLRQFAERFKLHRNQVRMAKSMNRAASGGYTGDEATDEETSL